MPQGSLKKIEIQLLLADLAFQFGNAFARRLKLRGRRIRRRPRTCAARSQTGLGRPATAAQPLGTAGLEAIPPSIQILARHLKLTCQGAHALTRLHPADDADLELSAELTVGRFGARFVFGHTFSYGELSLIFRVSISGGTPGKIKGTF